MSVRLDRRTVLKGLLGGTVVSIGLPPLDIFFNGSGTAYADASPFPTRFGLFFWGNGTIPDKWVPQGEGAGDAWQLSEQLMPLAGHKDKLAVVSGLRVMIPNRIPHWSGAAGVLAAVSGKGRDNSYTMNSPTIDQVIANGLEAQGQITRYRSIEYGAAADGGLSYSGPDAINPAETSPRALFERIFTDGFRAPGSAAGPDPELAQRRSVLDAVLGQGKRMSSKLGAVDRQRLESHFEGIRELEKRIRFLEENPIELAACAVPDEPPAELPDDGSPVSAANQALTDVMTMALACDQTRVFSNWITRPVNNLLFEGTTAGHHQLTHDEPGDQPQVNTIVKQLMTEFARMLDGLRQIPEGDGTLLDHCLIMGTSDVSLGRVHSLDEFPILLVGGGGGAVKTDFHWRSATQDNVTKLLITVQKAMGMPVEEFGQEEAFARGAIDSVLA